MKIIVAGFSKTGTKSLSAALTELGYEVYDFIEHFWFHGDFWKKIRQGKGTIDDFRKMYKNVDVTIDTPAFLFWEEIHQAFPDAKIILTVRDEESWFKSLCNQMEEATKSRAALYTQIGLSILPTLNKFYQHSMQFGGLLGLEFKSVHSPLVANEMILKQKYRQHNAYVKLVVPKDQLLVYQVTEGWEPLCEFLGKPVPDKPFPRQNVAGKDVDGYIQKHALGKQVFKEFKIFIALLVVVFIAIVYFILFIPKDKVYAVLSVLASTIGML